MNKRDIIQLLETLDAVPGVSGREEAVGVALETALEGCFDEARTDALGNRFFVRRGTPQGPRVLLMAHMDEIGFFVGDMDEEGYLLPVPVGHHDARLLQNQVFAVYTPQGVVYGVSGPQKLPHELKGAAPGAFGLEDLRIDIGARSLKSAQNMGVSVGTPILCARDSRMLGKSTFCGRAVDNRAGCAAMTAAMRMLRGTQTSATVIACGTVQEELGAKGAKAAAFDAAPDIALAFDVCFGARGTRGGLSRSVLGQGPAIQLYDWSPGSLMGNVVPASLAQRLVKTAQETHIPYQLEVTLDGGTDAASAAFAGAGTQAGSVNLPCRYMHTAVGTVDVGDVFHAGVLAANFIRGL